MAGGSEHPGILYFYSECIGFGVNGVCAFVAALTNLGVGERGISTSILFIVIGGFIQLLCKYVILLIPNFGKDDKYVCNLAIHNMLICLIYLNEREMRLQCSLQCICFY